MIVKKPFARTIAFFCPEKLKRPFSSVINLLAGIPSVVYGFFGIVFLLPMLANFAPNNGSGLLATSIILGIMILPTVVSLSKTSLEAVPKAYYEGAVATGSTHTRAVFGIMIPAARSGITASLILGVGRALGETMAVVMVAGNAAQGIGPAVEQEARQDAQNKHGDTEAPDKYRRPLVEDGADFRGGVPQGKPEGTGSAGRRPGDGDFSDFYRHGDPVRVSQVFADGDVHHCVQPGGILWVPVPGRQFHQHGVHAGLPDDGGQRGKRRYSVCGNGQPAAGRDAVRRRAGRSRRHPPASHSDDGGHYHNFRDSQYAGLRRSRRDHAGSWPGQRRRPAGVYDADASDDAYVLSVCNANRKAFSGKPQQRD